MQCTLTLDFRVPLLEAVATELWECRNACFLDCQAYETKCTCCEMGHEEEEELQCDRQAAGSTLLFC